MNKEVQDWILGQTELEATINALIEFIQPAKQEVVGKYKDGLKVLYAFSTDNTPWKAELLGNMTEHCVMEKYFHEMKRTNSGWLFTFIVDPKLEGYTHVNRVCEATKFSRQYVLSGKRFQRIRLGGKVFVKI